MQPARTAAVICAIAAAPCLAACGEAEDPSPPVGSVEATPSPSSTLDSTVEAALDAEVMEGNWFVKQERGLELALFGPPETDSRITLSCDPDTGDLTIGFVGDAAEPQTYRIAGGDDVLSISARSDGNEVLPYVEATIDATDPAITALAKAPEGVVITYPDGTAWRVPTDPKIAPVLEACS